jgi:hypothetical protein
VRRYFFKAIGVRWAAGDMHLGNFRAFVAAIRADWFAAMSGGFSVPFGAAAVFADTKYGQAIWGSLAVCAFVFAAYRFWSAEHASVLSLKEKLRPKIKVINFQCDFLPLSDGRLFEFEVKNDSGEHLQSCLAVVTAMSPTRWAGHRSEDSENMASIYLPNLPLALRTVRNLERDGDGPFNLRPGQTKKIAVCSRRDGQFEELRMFFEPGKDSYMYHVPNFKSCDIEISLLGAPSPTVERFKLGLNDRHQLIVMHNGKTADHKHSARPLLASEKWLSIGDAVDAFAEKELVAAKNELKEKLDAALEKGHEAQEKIRELTKNGTLHYTGDIEPARIVAHARRTMEACAIQRDHAQGELPNAWEAMRADVHKKLNDGILIARGFRAPHVGGAGEVTIPQDEWRILALDNVKSEVTTKRDGQIAYTGVVIRKA